MAKGLTVVKNYVSVLGLRETERAIKDVKDIFERTLSEKLNLERITAPLFVEKSSGINDDLNGAERTVKSCNRWRNGSVWRCIGTVFPRARDCIRT